MNTAIEKLEPQVVWQEFKNITQVPRPSKHEDKMREYLIDFAKKHQLAYQQTVCGNIVISKKATDVAISHKKIVLQAHMDMVPAKSIESNHDFLNDPIRAYIDNDFVRADNTTLGADNGMGMAFALAVLKSSQIKHNDLEVLFTTDEEAGMTGAFGLEGNELNSEILINLDSECDSEVCVGCAGGINTNIDIPITKVKTQFNLSCKIELKGLLSGHSGMDIDLERVNAIKEMGLILNQITIPFELVAINGGKLRNVIAAYSYAIINLDQKNYATLEHNLALYQQALSKEYANSDPQTNLNLVKLNHLESDIISNQNLVIKSLASVFNGVWKRDSELKIVETSSNLGKIETLDNMIKIISLQRSSIESAKLKVAASVASSFAGLNSSITHEDNYPGWRPNYNSNSLKLVKKLYKKKFNQDIKVVSIHAGLECGLILDKFPDMDAISIGATMHNAHTINECVYIPSVSKSWDLLINLIEEL